MVGSLSRRVSLDVSVNVFFVSAYARLSCKATDQLNNNPSGLTLSLCLSLWLSLSVSVCLYLSFSLPLCVSLSVCVNLCLRLSVLQSVSFNLRVFIRFSFAAYSDQLKRRLVDRVLFSVSVSAPTVTDTFLASDATEWRDAD